MVKEILIAPITWSKIWGKMCKIVEKKFLFPKTSKYSIAQKLRKE